jgi:type VI secretion system protein ImpM
MLPLSTLANPAALVQNAMGWFVRGETLLLGALEDGFDFDAFDRAVAELGAPGDDRAAAPAEPPPGELPGRRYAAPGAALGEVYAGMADRAFRAAYGKYSLWWTAGSEDMEPSFVACEGLPKMSGFAAFLDGEWARWGWSADGAPAPRPAVAQPPAAPPAPAAADPLDDLLPSDRA